MSLVDDVLAFGRIKQGLAAFSLNTVSEEDAVKVLTHLGFKTIPDVKQFLDLAREVSVSDEETIMEFISGGGLARMFNTRKTGKRPATLVVECNHCGELTCIDG